MRSAWIFMLLLLLLPSRFPALGEFALPEDGILTITSNMADRSYFEGKMMYLFYSRDFYILEFPYVKRNDAENTNFKSFVFRKSYVERFVKALNLHRFEEHAGSLDDSGGFIRINYTGGRSAELYISNKTYLIFEEKKERKAYVSSLDASTVQNLISSLLYDGERQSLDFIKLTYGDSERRAYTKFNNNLKTVRLWTASFSGEDVISVIWEPCGCRHDSSDPDYTRFNKAYLYFYVHDGQIVGKEILKENQTVKESERDMTLLEKDYLAHNRIETPAPVTLPPTVPPTESPSPTEPPTQTPLPTSAPTEPPTFTPMPSPTVSEDALLSFSIGLIFGSISFAIAFFAGNHRRNRKPFK